MDIRTGIKDMMVAASILGLAAGGLSYLNGYAKADTVKVAMSKADYALDKQMEYILQQINRIEVKPHKTAYDLQQLQYLKEELERMRAIRRGK